MAPGTSDAATGSLVDDSAGEMISPNTLDSNQYGIAVEGDSDGSVDGGIIYQNSIYNNEIFDAVDICGAGTTTVSGNTIWGATASAIHLDSSFSAASNGNAVSNNHVNGACAGVPEGMGSGGTVTAPIALCTVNSVLQGFEQCTAATVWRLHEAARGH